MNIDTLITMANQIGDFFGAYPDKELAKREIASHLKRFWALPMREQLIKHVSEKQGTGLHAVVKDAVSEYLAKDFVMTAE